MFKPTLNKRNANFNYNGPKSKSLIIYPVGEAMEKQGCSHIAGGNVNQYDPIQMANIEVKMAYIFDSGIPLLVIYASDSIV